MHWVLHLNMMIDRFKCYSACVDELRIKRFLVIQEEISWKASWRWM